MDNPTRKELAAIAAKVDELCDQLEAEFVQQVNQFAADEREKFDNLNAGAQGSERGQKIEAAADALDQASDSLEEATTALRNVVDQLTTAQD